MCLGLTDYATVPSNWLVSRKLNAWLLLDIVSRTFWWKQIKQPIKYVTSGVGSSLVEVCSVFKKIFYKGGKCLRKQLSYLSLHLSGELRSSRKVAGKKAVYIESSFFVEGGWVSLNNFAFELSDLTRPWPALPLNTEQTSGWSRPLPFKSLSHFKTKT